MIGRTLRALAAPRRGESAALDGLRAIAVLLVLARHGIRPAEEIAPGALAWTLPGGWAVDLSTPLRNGWIGVDLFFVLSGFLIARSLLRISHSQAAGLRFPPGALGRFAAGRALRILPAYVAVLTLALLGAFPFFAPEPSAASVVGHFLLLQDYTGSDVVVAFWSLGVEEKFYAAAPLLVWAAARAPFLSSRYALLAALIVAPMAARAATAAIGGVPADYPGFFADFRSPFHVAFDGLAVGLLIAFLERDRPRLTALLTAGRVRAAGLGGAVLVAALLAQAPMMGSIGWWDVTLQPVLIAAGFGAVVAAAVLAPATMPKWLADRGLRILARLSYALYLIHMPLIPAALVLSGGSAAAFWALYLGLSLLGAVLLHCLVEAPFLRLKTRIGAGAETLTQRKAPVAASRNVPARADGETAGATR